MYPSPVRAGGIGREAAFELPVSCPECGGSGSVPPEILSRVARAVSFLLQVEELPEDQWDAALDLLRGAEEGDRRVDLVSRLHERAPALAGLAASVPGDAPAQWRGFAAVLDTARQVVTESPLAGGGASDGDGAGRRPGTGDRAAGQEVGEEEPEALEELVSQVIARALEEHGASRQPSPEEGARIRARRRLRDTGRNDACPCGSGEKYKACHWTEDLRLTRS